VRAWQHAGGEPTLAQLDALLADARAWRPDWIAAIGGGSVLDIGKACAGLLHAPLPPAAYHGGEAIPPAHTPFAAVPTTAGTGSEATIVTVLTDERAGLKKSIRHPTFMPRLVILDAHLLAGCPPAVVAASGMDALTQAIESYISRGATWFSDALAGEAMRRIHAALPRVVAGAGGPDAEALLTGSYLAGLALSHARLGLVHGLAHPLGLRYHAPHGVVCAVCLPEVLAFNHAAAGDKYGVLADLLGGDPVACTRALLASLGIVSPFRGQALIDEPAIVSETLASGSTAANPRAVSEDDVKTMLARLFAAGEAP
jgi:alcohol dehydrogenase class IV